MLCFFNFLCLVTQATPSDLEAKSFGWIDQVAGVPLHMSLQMNDKAVNLVSRKMLVAHVLPGSLSGHKEEEASMTRLFR